MNHLCGDSPAGSRPVLLVSGLLLALLVRESLVAQLHWEDTYFFSEPEQRRQG